MAGDKGEIEKMIDFGKIQADAVKSIYKSKITGGEADYGIYSAVTIDGNKYIPFAYKGISIYLIPEEYCLLRQAFAEIDKLMVEKIFKSLEDAEQITDTEVIKILPDGRQLKEFKTKDDKSIFVDEKLIKPFGQDIKHYVGENSDIVYTKGVDEWLGLVLATRVREGRVIKKHTVYRCEICGADYSERDQAEGCEECHKTDLVVEKAEYKPCDWVNCGFPDLVTLKSKDEKTAIYRRMVSE